MAPIPSVGETVLRQPNTGGAQLQAASRVHHRPDQNPAHTPELVGQMQPCLRER